MAATDGLSMNDALMKCEIVHEERLTDAGPGLWYFLKIGDKLVPLGRDEAFAKSLQFALERNAKHFHHNR